MDGGFGQTEVHVYINSGGKLTVPQIDGFLGDSVSLLVWSGGFRDIALLW